MRLRDAVFGRFVRRGIAIVKRLLAVRARGFGGKSIDNIVREIAEITRSLKLAAKELNVPILLLGLLNVTVAGFHNKRTEPVSPLRCFANALREVNMKNYIFDLYNTLIDVKTDEHCKKAWTPVGEYFAAHGIKTDEKRLCYEFVLLDSARVAQVA